jgi:hypothetical protein
LLALPQREIRPSREHTPAQGTVAPTIRHALQKIPQA